MQILKAIVKARSGGRQGARFAIPWKYFPSRDIITVQTAAFGDNIFQHEQVRARYAGMSANYCVSRKTRCVDCCFLDNGIYTCWRTIPPFSRYTPRRLATLGAHVTWRTTGRHCA